MGDIAMTVPVVHELAAQYPHILITFLSKPLDRVFFENLAPNVFFMGADIKVPIIVRLQGTNAEIAKEIIDKSGLAVHSAIQFQEAADKVKEVLK